MKLKKLLPPIIVLTLFSIFTELRTYQYHVSSPISNDHQYLEKTQSVSLPPPISNDHQYQEKTQSVSLPSPEVTPTPRISLMFTGDINLGRCIAKTAITFNDFTYPFRLVADKLRSADITIGSLDSTLSDQSPPMSCPDSMNLIGPAGMVDGLQFAGFDVITVATNHIKDCGAKGYDCENNAFLDTINNLTNAGIVPVGGGENLNASRLPVVVESQGIRFAFLGVNEIDERVWATDSSPGTAPLSPEVIDQIKADIVSAKKMADVVIVLPQWGIEYAGYPEEMQRNWAQEFIDAGASLVIGNHPHIVQPAEVFLNGVAFYALGNFVFDQDQHYRREGVVVHAIFNGAQLASWQLEPVSINYYTYQPYWAEGSEAEKILERAAFLIQ